MKMLPCNVEWHYSALLVIIFKENEQKELLLQSDYDQASFACNCGLIESSEPSSQEWADCDPTEISECPDDYWDVTG